MILVIWVSLIKPFVFYVYIKPMTKVNFDHDFSALKEKAHSFWASSIFISKSPGCTNYESFSVMIQQLFKKKAFHMRKYLSLNLIVGVWSNTNNKVLRLVNFGKYLWFHWIFNFVVEFVHFDSYSISETRDLDFSKLFSSSPMLVSLRDTALIY